MRQTGLRSTSESVGRTRYEIYAGAFLVGASVTWLVVMAAMIFADDLVNVTWQYYAFILMAIGLVAVAVSPKPNLAFYRVFFVVMGSSLLWVFAVIFQALLFSGLGEECASDNPVIPACQISSFQWFVADLVLLIGGIAFFVVPNVIWRGANPSKVLDGGKILEK